MARAIPSDQPDQARAHAPASHPRPVNRVLMLCHRLPYPPDRGDRIRSYHLLKQLANHFDMAIACTSDEPVWLQHHQLLSTIAKRVTIQPITRTVSAVRGGWALATGRAITPATFFRGALAEQMLQWHEEQPFDAVLTFCSGMVHYARLLTLPALRRRSICAADHDQPPRHVLDLVDVDSAKWRSYAQATLSPMRLVYGAEARRLKQIEAGKVDRYDAITVISEAEKQAYRDHVGADQPVHVVNNGVAIDYFRPAPDAGGHQLVFVGVLNYKPNTMALTWFVKHVMPRLRQRVDDAALMIVGRNPNETVLELDQVDGVKVVGSVPDVRDYLHQATAVIAPLQIARGVQNKVLEAMASGRAVVCSPEAADGIDACPDRELLIAKDPDQWCDKIAALFQSQDMRCRIAEAGRRFVEQHHDWSACARPMVDLLRGPAC